MLAAAAGCLISAVRALDEASPRLKCDGEMREEIDGMRDRIREIVDGISNLQNEIRRKMMERTE